MHVQGFDPKRYADECERHSIEVDRSPYGYAPSMRARNRAEADARKAVKAERTARKRAS